MRFLPKTFIAALVAFAPWLNAQTIQVVGNSVGIGTSTPGAKLSVAGAVQIMNGDNTTGYSNLANIGFGYNGTPTYQHFLQTRHDAAAGGIGNALVLWLNNSVGANGSTQPGTGNVKAFDFSTDNLKFYTNNGVERVSITSSGNVGIGQTNPSATLQIRTTNTTANATTEVLRLEHIPAASAVGAAGLGSEVGFYTVNATPYYYQGAGISHLQTNVVPGNEENALAFKTYSMSNGGWKESMRIQGGNVGIGTTAPSGILHTYGGTNARPIFESGNGINYARFLSHTGGGNYGTSIEFFDGSTNSAAINTVASGGIRLATAGAERLTIDGGGNVGIGTTSPGYKLHVNGTVRATNFISDTTTYADFVFKPGYTLDSLSEVEAHIQAHGTLPGVPSEAQVAKEGIDLAQMQVKLLQKVEELTLHLIAQEKCNTRQDSRIQALEEENNKLRARLNLQ